MLRWPKTYNVVSSFWCMLSKFETVNIMCPSQNDFTGSTPCLKRIINLLVQVPLVYR